MIEYAAQLNGNIVGEVIVGNYQWAIDNLGGVWVDCTCGENPCASPGYIYDEKTQTFSQPKPPVVE